MFAYEDVKFFSLQVHTKLETGYTEEKLNKVGSSIFYLLKLCFTASNAASFKSRASCYSSFYFFLKGLLFCVAHFTNSKCKKLTFSFSQVNIGRENNIY